MSKKKGPGFFSKLKDKFKKKEKEDKDQVNFEEDLLGDDEIVITQMSSDDIVDGLDEQVEDQIPEEEPEENLEEEQVDFPEEESEEAQSFEAPDEDEEISSPLLDEEEFEPEDPVEIGDEVDEIEAAPPMPEEESEIQTMSRESLEDEGPPQFGSDEISDEIEEPPQFDEAPPPTFDQMPEVPDDDDDDIDDKTEIDLTPPESYEDEEIIEEDIPDDVDYEDEEEDEAPDFSQLQTMSVNRTGTKEIDVEELQKQSDPTGTKEIDPSKLKYVNDIDEEVQEDDVDFEDMQQMEVSLPKAENPLPGNFAQKLKHSVSSLVQKTKEAVSPGLSKGLESIGKARKGSKFANLTWDSVVDSIFSQNSRAFVHKGFIASMVAAGTYGTGKMTALIVKGPEKRIKKTKVSQFTGGKTASVNINDISKNNIFNAKLNRDDSGGPKKDVQVKRVDPRKICHRSSQNSKLPLKLVSTTVLQDSVKSIASVSVRGEKKLKEFREGEKVAGMAQIGKIERLRVIFKNLQTGECEFIASKKDRDRTSPINVVSEREGKKIMNAAKPDGISNVGNKYTIKKNLRDQMLADIGNVLTQARAIQIKNPDGTFCFKMTEIVPGSIYSHLNIQNEDIICKLNGKEITDLNDVMTMFGKIKDIDNLSITVDREGSEQELEYEFD